MMNRRLPEIEREFLDRLKERLGEDLTWRLDPNDPTHVIFTGRRRRRAA
jgi:hypothetical protein